MGQACSKNMNEDNGESLNNVRQPDDAELVFLVAFEKAKHGKGPASEPPGPSAPMLTEKQLRTVGSVRNCSKPHAPYSMHAGKAQAESSTQLIWLRPVSLEDSIPGGSQMYVVRKMKLPDDRIQIQSAIDKVPAPKKVFIVRMAQPKPQKPEEVTFRESSDSPVQGMSKTPVQVLQTSTQNTASGQSESQAFRNTPLSQSEIRALSQAQVAKKARWNAYIKQLMAQMGSKCIQERIRAINQLVEDCTLKPEMVMPCIFSVFDTIRARLLESNRCVNLHMLEALGTIIPQMKESLNKVVYQLIPAIADNHLNSKTNAIYCSALAAIRSVVHNLDNSILLEVFVTKAQLLGGRAKTDLTDAVTDMAIKLYPRRPKMVEQQALPLLWHMLAVRSRSAATATLFRALYGHMGARLWVAAAYQPVIVRNGLQRLLSSAH